MENLKIERFRITRLRNMEYTLVVPRIINIIERYFPESLRITRRLDALKAFLPELDKIEAHERRWHASQEKNDCERQRDEAVNAIIRTERTYSHLAIPAMNEVSKMLTHLFDKHGRDIASDNETSETQRIYNLVEDIERTPGMPEALEAFALTPIYENMKNNNIRFDELWRQRNKETSEITTVDVKAIRCACDKALIDLFNGIEYCAAEYTAEEYIPLINELNKLAVYYRQNLKARHIRLQNGAKSQEEPIMQPEG